MITRSLLVSLSITILILLFAIAFTITRLAFTMFMFVLLLTRAFVFALLFILLVFFALTFSFWRFIGRRFLIHSKLTTFGTFWKKLIKHFINSFRILHFIRKVRISV